MDTIKWSLNLKTLDYEKDFVCNYRMFVGWIIPGITNSSFLTALIASIVIALVNIVIKPILVFLTLPINILTLGIFSISLFFISFIFSI